MEDEQFERLRERVVASGRRRQKRRFGRIENLGRQLSDFKKKPQKMEEIKYRTQLCLKGRNFYLRKKGFEKDNSVINRI